MRKISLVDSCVTTGAAAPDRSAQTNRRPSPPDLGGNEGQRRNGKIVGPDPARSGDDVGHRFEKSAKRRREDLNGPTHMSIDRGDQPTDQQAHHQTADQGEATSDRLTRVGARRRVSQPRRDADRHERDRGDTSDRQPGVSGRTSMLGDMTSMVLSIGTQR